MCTIKSGTKIGSWDANGFLIPMKGETDITIKDKIGQGYKNITEAEKAAAEKETQAAVVSEKDGTYSLYEIDDGAYFSDLGIDPGINQLRPAESMGGILSVESMQSIVINKKGSSLGVVAFIDEYGTSQRDYSLERVKTLEKTISDLESKAKSANPIKREQAACLINASPELFRKMANDPEIKVKITLAGNAAAPPDVFRKLNELNDLNVNKALAGNYAIPADLRIKLAKSSSEEVKSILIANCLNGFNNKQYDAFNAFPNLNKDVAVFNRTETFKNHEILQDELKNKLKEANAQKPEIMEILAKDPSKKVRLEVANHIDSKTSVSILNILAKDKDPQIRAIAKKEIDTRNYLKD